MKKAAAKTKTTAVKAASKKEASNPVEVADLYYEECLVQGVAISLAEVEVNHGLKPSQLVNYRKNRAKIEKARREGMSQAMAPGSKFTPVPTGASLVTVPMETVVVCPLNPRKRIDAALIEEMADSILEHDIIQPPIARPGRYEGTFEVVFGQRRLLGKRRAIEKAMELGRTPIAATIQLLVREMDDRTVLEEAWVENLQRVDVGAREEAEGFQAMLDLRDDAGEPVYSIRSLAVKFGKNQSYVSRRVKMQNAPEEMWMALEAHEIGLEQIMLVSSLPDEVARKKAAGKVLRPQFRTAPPLTVTETREMLKAEFMISLRGCEWELKDETLVATKRDKSGGRIFGGACEDCPFRAGSDPDLQESLGGGGGGVKRGAQGVDAKTCLLPTCYAAKQGAAWKRTMQDASANGSRVLTEDEAKKVFASWGSGGVISHSNELVSLSESPGFYETGHHAGADTLSTWGTMIDVSKVDPKVLVVGRSEHTGKVHVLLKRDVAIALAEAGLGKKGKDSPFSNRPGVHKDGNDDDEEGEVGGRRMMGGPSEYALKRERSNKLEVAAAAKIAEMVNLQRTPKEDVMTELVLASLWEEAGYGGGMVWDLLKERGVPEFVEVEGRSCEESLREWMDAVLRPEIALAPLAWAAMVLLNRVDVELDFDDPIQSEPLFQVLGLDREAIVAEEDPEVDGEEEGEEEVDAA